MHRRLAKPAQTRRQAVDDKLANVERRGRGGGRRVAYVDRSVRLDDQKIVDQAITDCKEILDVVMEGDVKQWLS